MKEIEILEDEKIKNGDKPIKLPDNFVVVGETDVNDVKIYIKQKVYKEIEKFSKKDTTNERGGILIGDYAEVNNKKNVIITDFIEAKYTDASASTLTFTHETWNYIHEEQEKLYPDKKIIGWQHTHPSYGIFLSNYDIFIQENFFNLPWQIAYVVDPIADTRGFFQWKSDKVEKTSGFYIFDEVGEKISIKKAKSPKKKGKVNWFSISLVILTVILFILTLKLCFEKVSIINQLNEMILNDVKITQENSELAQKLQQSDDDLKKLQKNNDSPQQSKENDNLAKADNAAEDNSKDIMKIKIYTVQAGDTLGAICKKNNIDYLKNKAEILKMNGIENEDKIYSGQKLYLPLH